MSPTHEQLLAELQSKLHAQDVDAQEVDQRVAAALGVDVSDFHRYLAVRGALEARRQLVLAAGPANVMELPSGDEVLDRVRRQVDVIGGLVALLYERACETGDRQSVSAAARILGSLPMLRHTLATRATSWPRLPRRRVRRG